MTTQAAIRTVAELAAAPAEFQVAIRKIVRSHSINELHGARVFDEPAIAYAPTPYAKWLTCRIAMEEYGHHVRFRQLGEQIGVPADELVPGGPKQPLSIFSFPLSCWEEFCVIKLLADLAEILQVEDLLQCSFHPLRNLARMTMPEERFHAQFGKDFCAELCGTADGRAKVQDAIDRYLPMLPPFFGRSNSPNNALFRRFGIKRRTNEDMRAEFLAQASALVVDHLKLKLPPMPDAA